MSDCSREAMLPKQTESAEVRAALSHDAGENPDSEANKTCGTCSERCYAAKCNRLGWVDFEENDTPDDDGATFADFCIYYKKADPDTLEQRCQQLEQAIKKQDEGVLKMAAREDQLMQQIEQLEQVARDALAVISMACSLTNGDPEMRCVNLNCKKAHKSLRSRLEALGVRVDD